MNARPPSHAAIEVDRLRKSYPGGVEAVKGIEFQVANGEVFGLVGPNGAGKSTTIGMLTTTIAPTAGSARLAGFDVAGEPLAARRASSVVFQDPVVDRALTGRRNLDIHARLWGVDRAAATSRVAELAEALGLSALIDRPVGSYSGGQRRRLEIARALVSEPQVLFLDEPTVGLDPRIRHELLDVLGRLRARSDMTILVTTHYLEEAERLCDRVGIIDEGRIRAEGTRRELVDLVGQRDRVRLIAGGDLAAAATAARAIPGVHEATAGDGSLDLLVTAGRSLLPGLLAVLSGDGIAIRSVEVIEPDLEAVFLHLTGKALRD
jgi:ABC-2 type transport system ATP-binding protein